MPKGGLKQSPSLYVLCMLESWRDYTLPGEVGLVPLQTPARLVGIVREQPPNNDDRQLPIQAGWRCCSCANLAFLTRPDLTGWCCRGESATVLVLYEDAEKRTQN